MNEFTLFSHANARKMKLHKEGWIYCLVATALLIITLFLLEFLLGNFAFLFDPLALAAILLWFWVFWFFRIPNRHKTTGENLIISPCDGKVVVIEETTESEYFKDKRIQVSIFMSPLNVHVNCYPISGIVQYVKYHAGKFLVAWHPKSSTENERSTIVIKGNKIEILVRQIAGAVARRIITYSKINDPATQNGELGFIKFGSRVDVFLPIGTDIKVNIGDIVQNGVSTLASY